MRGEHQPTTHQANREVEPKIYAASLSDYNNGHLHGAWIPAAQPAEIIHDHINTMLTRSPIGNAEEWAIHDYEGFGAFKLGEYEDINTVVMIANGIVEHGRAFSHWANVVGTQDHERLHRFDEHYRGHWPSLGDYAENMLDDMGVSVESFTPGWLLPYVSIDHVALGNDLATDLETADDPSGGIHLFEPNT